MIRITLPSGECIEIHDDLIERAFGVFAQERDALLDALYDLLKERNPDTCARARAVLHYHRRG